MVAGAGGEGGNIRRNRKKLLSKNSVIFHGRGKITNFQENMIDLG